MADLPTRYEQEAIVLWRGGPHDDFEPSAVRVDAPGSIEVNEHGMAVFDPDGRENFKPMGLRIPQDDVVRIDGEWFRDDVELDES